MTCDVFFLVLVTVTNLDTQKIFTMDIGNNTNNQDVNTQLLTVIDTCLMNPYNHPNPYPNPN